MNKLKEPQFILAIFYTLVYFAVLMTILLGYAQVPEPMVETVKPLIVFLTVGQVKALDYFYQSSFGSRSKDEAMRTSQTK